MKHTKQNGGMSRRIMALFLTACLVTTSFSPIVSAQAAESTSDPILLCGFAELPNEIKAQSVPLGVSLEALKLPVTLEATACPALKDTEPVLPEEPKKQPAPLSIQNITWGSDPVYAATAPGVYTFTAILPQGYALQEGTALPKILVTVKADAIEKTAYEKVVELFLALPGAAGITAETTGEEKDAIRARLDKAMAAHDALTQEEKAQFDREHADLLAAALALQSAVISEPLMTLPNPLPPETKAAANAAVDATVDTFAELQKAIAAAPTDKSAYVIEVTADFEITTCLYLHATDTNITIRGDTPARKLTRTVNNNYLFSVYNNASLTLESIVIDGNKNNNDSNTLTMIIVQGTANLALNQGAVLQNNKAKDQSGAVYIGGDSTFSMSGAKILNNDGKQSGG
ncbi:MAG: hypothetical protein RSC36_02515, partial [Ruthenibacterium sp.]